MLCKFFNKVLLTSTLFLVNVYSSVPAIWNLPINDSEFIGRKKPIKILEEKLKKSNIVTVTGFGGLGKTRVAKQYANNHKGKYKVVYWFNAQVDMETQLVDLAEKYISLIEQKSFPDNFSQKKKIQYIMNKLRTRNDNWLLVFDNAENYQLLKPYFISNQTKGLGHIIVTSRSQNNWSNQFALTTFERNESVQLIKKQTGTTEERLAHKLADLLNDYPLAITRACAYIKKFSSLENYIRLYETQKTKLLQKTGHMKALLNDYYLTSYATISLSLNKIKVISEDAWHLILCMSLLKNINIPVEYIEVWVNKFAKGKSFATILNNMQSQSLIERNPNNPKLFNIHELVSQVIQNHIPKESKRKYIEQSIKILLSAFDGRSDKMVEKIIKNRHHLYHAEQLLSQIKNKGLQSNQEIIALKVALVECYMCLVNRPRCEELTKQVDEAIASNQKGWMGIFYKPTKAEAIFYINKSKTAGAHYADYKSGVSYAKKAFEILISIEDIYQEKIRAISRIVLYSTLMGDLKTAKEYVTVGQKFFEYCPSIHDQFVFVYSQLRAEQLEGNRNKVLHTYKILRKYYILISNYIPKQLYTLGFMLEIMHRLGDYSKFDKIISQFSRKAASFYGKDIPAFRPVADMELFGAAKLIHLGQVDKKAENKVKNAIKILDKIYHGAEKTIVQAEAEMILSDLYVKRAKRAKSSGQRKVHLNAARLSLLAAERILNKMMKYNVNDYYSELYTKMCMVYIMIGDSTAMASARKVFYKHTDLFGANHPRTLKLIEYLNKHKIAIP